MVMVAGLAVVTLESAEVAVESDDDETGRVEREGVETDWASDMNDEASSEEDGAGRE